MTGSQVWLLIGLPVDKPQLVRRLSPAAGENDFCLEFGPPAGSDDTDYARAAWIEAMFATAYRPKVGAAIASLASAARAAGVTVVEEAGIAALAEASRLAHVIIIVSHWKAHEFAGEDFLPGFADEAPARLAAADSPVAGWLRREIGPRKWYQTAFRPRPSLSLALHRLADADLDDLPKLSGLTGFSELPATRGARRRAEVDRLFQGLVRPGNRFELFDGLHPREAIAAALERFHGLLDLTTCTSTWLGDYVTHRSQDRIRTIQFPTVQEFHDAGAKLTATIELLSAGWSYLEARMAVQRNFVAVLNQAMTGKQA